MKVTSTKRRGQRASVRRVPDLARLVGRAVADTIRQGEYERTREGRRFVRSFLSRTTLWFVHRDEEHAIDPLLCALETRAGVVWDDENEQATACGV